MTAIDPTAASTPTQGTTGTKTSSGLAATSDTFLKLLVANLQHQDPMQPQDSSAFMSQLSSMTMVEQLTSLAQTSQASQKNQQALAAVGLLGKQVTYIDANGASRSGTVQRVDVAGSNPTLTVDGVDGVNWSLVSEIAP